MSSGLMVSLSSPAIRGCCFVLREREGLSKAAFARYLHLIVGDVSQLERGVKQPKGPALALLNVIRRKGLRVML